MLFPYSTEVVLTRWPVSNILIIAGCAAVFVLELMDLLPPGVRESMVLYGWNPIGLLGNIWLHGGILHLVFNMWFLWIFGNAVCERLGSLRYAGVYMLCALYADMLMLLLDGRPAIGASGAIFGIIGFYLALYPINVVNCAYLFMFRFGTVEVYGFWMVLLWFANDIFGIVTKASDGIGHYAHVGGFLSGLATGLLMLAAGWVTLAEYDNPSLLDYIRGCFGLPKLQTEREPEDEAPVPMPEPRRRIPVPETMPLAPEPPPFRASLAPLPAFDDVEAECPYCQSRLKLPRKMLGSSFKCPSCSRDIEMSEA